jgi:hypothetical protein
LHKTSPGGNASLYLILKLLEERDEVTITDVGAGERLGDTELPRIANLIQHLSHLRANGLLTYRTKASTARVRYGPSDATSARPPHPGLDRHRAAGFPSTAIAAAWCAPVLA